LGNVSLVGRVIWLASKSNKGRVEHVKGDDGQEYSWAEKDSSTTGAIKYSRKSATNRKAERLDKMTLEIAQVRVKE
jgi:hypothetical protein